ncbi:MAG TPA: HAD family hydrolase [Candidatus Dojkabacteria bacterium]|nr:HAD family hydrolase [Candidatus Dojkabacteria bacterium]
MKALVLDQDGVVIKKATRFSARLAEEYQVPPEKINEFFKNEFKDCLIDKKDLKESIKKYLPGWGWQGSVEELLEFWFHGESEINKDVLQLIRLLRAKGVAVYVATNNEKYRTTYVKKELGLGKEFDGFYSSADLYCLKPERVFYKKVTDLIIVNITHNKRKIKNVTKFAASDIIYWDDDEENVLGAEKFGWKAFLYSSFEDFDDLINQYLT